MALTAQEQQTLNELIGHITDENEKQQVRALYEKYEPLRAGYLRQSDYDRNLNSHKADLKKAKDAEQQAKGETKAMQDWWERTKATLRWKQTGDDGSGKFMVLEELQAKNKELEERVRTAATGAGNGDGTLPNQEAVTQMVMKSLEGREYVSKAEIDALVEGATKKLLDKERKLFFDQTVPATTEFIETWQDIRWRHYDEFKKPLDRKALHSHWQEHKDELKDKTPMEIYESYAATDLQKARERREADERKTLEEKWQKDWEEKRRRQNAGVPGTSNLDEPVIGSPVRERLSGVPSKPNGNEPPPDEGVKAPPTMADTMKRIRAASMRGVAALEKAGTE